MSCNSLSLYNTDNWILPEDCKIIKNFNETDETAIVGEVDGKTYAMDCYPHPDSRVGCWYWDEALSHEGTPSWRYNHKVYQIVFSVDQFERLRIGARFGVTFTQLVREVIEEQNQREKKKAKEMEKKINELVKKLTDLKNQTDPIAIDTVKHLTKNTLGYIG